ncbi:MAG: TonB-dependent receptor [Bacteroidales bacterium]
MKNIITILISLLSVVTTQPVLSQTKNTDANIMGHVVDATTGEHLAYITIALKGTTIGTVTDGSGHYFLKNLPVGEFTIVASSVGYTTVERKVRITRNKNQEINFQLAEQAMQVDEVVVSASRNETNKLTSPTIVNVASKKLFETTSSCNLAESMNFQSGLRVENNCGNCGTTQLRINGLEGLYSQVLLDSRPIFSSLTAVYGLEQLPVSMIERVEVVRGGGSALFGSNAIGGVVNIITKEPLRNSMMLSNTTNILKGGAADINTSLNGSFVTDDYKAGAYIFGMIKHRDAYDRNKDGFSDLPMLNSETIGFRGYYKTSNYSKLTAEYHHIHEFRRGGDNLSEAPHMADIAEQLNHKIDGGGLKFDYFSPDYKHKLGLYTSAQLIKRDSYFGVDKNPDAYGNTDDKTFVAGSQYAYSFEKCLFMPADLTAGLEYNFNKLHDQILGYGRDFTQTTHLAGLYFQNEWKSDKFNFLIGGRLDKHNLMKNAVFSPRVNIRYSPTKKIGLRASYSSGYRAPQAYNEDLRVDAVSGSIALIQIDPLLNPTLPL